jgi:hypothetical protein
MVSGTEEKSLLPTLLMLFPDDAVLTRQLPAFVVVDVISREIRN